MDYRIPFPEEQPEEGKLEEYSKILKSRLSLQIEDDNAEDDKEVAYPFPNGIISEAGKIILTIDFLMTCSGKRIGELFHLKEKESGTMVTLRWVMDLVPKKEMAILGKELHDEDLLRIHEDVKTKHVEKLALKRWKFRLEDDERLTIGDEGVVVDQSMFLYEQ
jgi:hypothetical protein